MTLPDPVRQWAETTPDAPALAGAADWSWAKLDARVGAAAAVLRRGPKRVAARAETSPNLVVLVLAALRARRLLVPLSTRWTPTAVSDALRQLGIDQLVTDDASPPDTVPLAEAAGDAFDGPAVRSTAHGRGPSSTRRARRGGPRPSSTRWTTTCGARAA